MPGPNCGFTSTKRHVRRNPLGEKKKKKKMKMKKKKKTKEEERKRKKERKNAATETGLLPAYTDGS